MNTRPGDEPCNTHAMFRLLCDTSPRRALLFLLREIGIVIVRFDDSEHRPSPSGAALLTRARGLLAPAVVWMHSDVADTLWSLPEVRDALCLAEHYLWSCHALCDVRSPSTSAVRTYQRALFDDLLRSHSPPAIWRAATADGWGV